MIPRLPYCCRGVDLVLTLTASTSLLLAATVFVVMTTTRQLTSGRLDNELDPSVMPLLSVGSRRCNDDPELTFLPYREHNNIDTTRSHFYTDDALARLVMQIHANCSNWVRLGADDDGGWDVCIAQPYRPTPRACLVYSFGIGYDFSFDDHIALKFGCTVRSFDPSMTVDTHQRSSNVWFYKIGLDGKETVNESGWTMRTLSGLMRQFNDTGATIDYLKLDIEGYEWSAIDEMLSSGTLSTVVRQLAVEVHFGSGRSSRTRSVQQWNILAGLERAGFRRWSYRPNAVGVSYQRHNKLYRIAQHEIVYLNRRFYLPP